MENVVAGSSANVVAGLSTIDYVIFGIYAIVIVAIGLYSSRKNTKSAEGYFLAGKSIPWWAVGASLIAFNTEQLRYHINHIGALQVRILR